MIVTILKNNIVHVIICRSDSRQLSRLFQLHTNSVFEVLRIKLYYVRVLCYYEIFKRYKLSYTSNISLFIFQINLSINRKYCYMCKSNVFLKLKTFVVFIQTNTLDNKLASYYKKYCDLIVFSWFIKFIQFFLNDTAWFFVGRLYIDNISFRYLRLLYFQQSQILTEHAAHKFYLVNVQNTHTHTHTHTKIHIISYLQSREKYQCVGLYIPSRVE